MNQGLPAMHEYKIRIAGMGVLAESGAINHLRSHGTLMSFRISGLSPNPFRHLFGASDATLKAHRAARCIVDAAHCYPERIELRDARRRRILAARQLHASAG